MSRRCHQPALRLERPCRQASGVGDPHRLGASSFGRCNGACASSSKSPSRCPSSPRSASVWASSTTPSATHSSTRRRRTSRRRTTQASARSTRQEGAVDRHAAHTPRPTADDSQGLSWSPGFAVACPAMHEPSVPPASQGPPPALARLPNRAMLTKIASVYDGGGREAPPSVPIVKAFGTRGIALLGTFLFAILMTGTFSVWWFTGIKSSVLVLCLTQLNQQESSAQMGAKLVELTSQASSILTLATASSALLMDRNGSTAASASDLLLRRTTIAAAGSTMVGPFEAYLASLVWPHAAFKLHIATAEGAYIGLFADAANASASIHRRPVGGCLTASTAPYSERGSIDSMGTTLASPYVSASALAGCNTSWRPQDQPWYAANASCGTATAYCWSRPYAVGASAAVALQLRLMGSGVDGVIAIEIDMAALERYMRTLLASSEILSTMDVVLLDRYGALLATTQPTHSATYAQPLPRNSAWQEVELALEREARGEANPRCFLASASRSAEESYCGNFEVGTLLCTKVGPLPAGGQCVLASECHVSSVVNASDPASESPLPEGWRMRLMNRKDEYYPGFDAANYLTLTFSISCSVIVSLLLSHLVWLYNSTQGQSEICRLPFCKLPVSPRIAQSCLVLLVLVTYVAVYVRWYTLYRYASHAWRDAIIQLLNEAMVDRFCSILETLPRTAHMIHSWTPLWNSSLEPAVDEGGELAFAPFSIFAYELIRAVQPSFEGGFSAAAPPLERLVVDAPILSILHVPAATTQPIRGTQLLVRPGHSNVSFDLIDDCVGDHCVSDPRLTSWWTPPSVSDVGASRWTEVHLLGDQLVVSFVLPISAGEADTPDGWIACSLPLAALQAPFKNVGTGSVRLAGLVMQSSTASTGGQQGALISSSAEDAESRVEVGGEWFTARRLASHSLDPSLRAAAGAVHRTLAGSRNTRPHYKSPMASHIGVQAGLQLGPTPRLMTPERSRIYRTFGAPRTHITFLRGAGCNESADAALGKGDCGLDWTAVMLIDWIDFFADWYRDRDFSLVVFFIFLVLQLHVVQVLVRSSFRHIEHEAAQTVKLEEPRRPNHQEAILELAQPDSSRSSSSSPRTSAGSARFERYRVHISDEVQKALKVRWQGFRTLRSAKAMLYRCIQVLPCGLQDLAEIKSLRMQLGPPELKGNKSHRQAIQFIRLAKQHRNLLTVCALRSGARFIALHCYLFQSTGAYRKCIQLVTFCHCLLQAYEPTPIALQRGRTAEPAYCPVHAGDAVMLLNFFCIAIETLDVVCSQWVVSSERAVHALRKRHVQIGPTAGSPEHQSGLTSFGVQDGEMHDAQPRSVIAFLQSQFEGDNLLQPRSEAIRRVLRSCILVGIWVDWLLLVSSCDVLVVPLRPVFLVLSSYSLSSTAVSITTTLFTRGMRSVGVCFLTLWLVMSMFVSTMLRREGNGIEPNTRDCDAVPGVGIASPPDLSVGSVDTLNDFSYTPVDFQAIIPSMLSTFILISTGENYADVVSRPLFCYDMLREGTDDLPTRGMLVLCFFIFLSLIGLVLMVGMFIGVFQDGVARQRRAEIRKSKLFERVGAIAAFSLLDVDESGKHTGKVPLSEFKEFLASLESNLEMKSVHTAERLFKLLHEEEGNGQNGDGVLEELTMTDFIFNLYYLQLTGVTFQRMEEAMTPSAWREWLRAAYDHPSQVVQKLVKFVLIMHTLLACLYGLLPTESISALDIGLAILLLLEALEVALKVAAYGPRRFWSCGQYDAARIFEQWENRTALAISGSTLLVWLVTRPHKASQGMGFKIAKNFHRLVLVMPTLRLFFVLKTARRIIFVLVPLRMYLFSVMFLMIAFNFMWATIGVFLFEGVLETISNALDPAEVRPGAFDSIGSAMLTLMQVLIGEGWHDIMFATMNGMHTWYSATYFMIFVVVQTLLLTNLLVGVVLDSTSNFEEELSLQQHLLHGDQQNELEELKQAYAAVGHRKLSEDEADAPDDADDASSDAGHSLGQRQVRQMTSSSEPAAGDLKASGLQMLRQYTHTARHLLNAVASKASTGHRMTSSSAASVASADTSNGTWRLKRERIPTPECGSIAPVTERLTSNLI